MTSSRLFRLGPVLITVLHLSVCRSVGTVLHWEQGTIMTCMASRKDVADQTLGVCMAVIPWDRKDGTHSTHPTPPAGPTKARRRCCRMLHPACIHLNRPLLLSAWACSGVNLTATAGGALGVLLSDDTWLSGRRAYVIPQRSAHPRREGAWKVRRFVQLPASIHCAWRRRRARGRGANMGSIPLTDRGLAGSQGRIRTEIH